MYIYRASHPPVQKKGLKPQGYGIAQARSICPIFSVHGPPHPPLATKQVPSFGKRLEFSQDFLLKNPR